MLSGGVQARGEPQEGAEVYRVQSGYCRVAAREDAGLGEGLSRLLAPLPEAPSGLRGAGQPEGAESLRKARCSAKLTERDRRVDGIMEYLFWTVKEPLSAKQSHTDFKGAAEIK